MTGTYRHDPTFLKAVETLIQTIQFDVNGTAGKGGNGGLTSDKAIRQSGELNIMMDRIKKTEATATPPAPEVFNIGDATRQKVFEPTGMRDVSDLQAVLDAVEVALSDAVSSTNIANEAAQFDSADFYWRTMDPDDSGEYPQDAINRAGLGQYCIAEIASSFTGPKRFGFIAPVLDLDSDEEEFLHFATQSEALKEAEARRVAIDLRETERERCVACDVPLEVGDLVYWCSSDDSGHLHAACCGPDRKIYVNPDGSPLKDDEPIPAPFRWKPDGSAPDAESEGQPNV